MYFEPVAPRRARNTIIESTFEVGRRFRCTMRIDWGQLDPGAVIRADPANASRACPSASTKRSWRTGVPGHNAVYQPRGPDRRRASRGRGRMSRA
jgi:hypothetical protein